MSLLDALYQGGHLRTLDHALAQSLRRLDRDTPEAVPAAAALASLAVAKGHAGVDLDAAGTLVDAELPWPDPTAWAQQLAASPWVATPREAASPPPPTTAPIPSATASAVRLLMRSSRLVNNQNQNEPIPSAQSESSDVFVHDR